MTENAVSTAEMLKLGSYVCFALAILFLIWAIVLFFRLRIRDVIYELSGKARSESIQKMTADYAITGSLSSASKNKSSAADDQSKGLMNTGQLDMRKSSSTKTAPRDTERTTIFRKEAAASSVKFVVTKDITVVHTNEHIM